MPLKRGAPQLPVTENDIRADRLRQEKLERAQSEANKLGTVYLRLTVLPEGRIRSLSTHISLSGGPRPRPEELERERAQGCSVEILEVTPEEQAPRPAKPSPPRARRQRGPG